MQSTCLRIVICILLAASVYGCSSVTPVATTQLLTQPTASPKASDTLVSIPQIPAASPTPLVYPGWLTFPEFTSIRAMLFDSQDSLWAVGPDGVILIYPDGQHRHFTIQDGLPSNDLLSIGLDSSGNVWVGANGSGVARFDGQSWQTFTTADGLGSNKVYSIINQRDYGGLLFGTQMGLSVYSDGNWGNFAGTGYLPDDEVRAITVFPTGSIWVGTRNGLTWFGPSETYTTADGLASDVINALTIAPDCSLWIGTSGGVSRYDGENWKSFTSADGLVDDTVSSAAATLDGSIWFGTQEGASRFDGQNWSTYTSADGLANDEVLSIAVAPDGTLWFGTSGGLSHYSAYEKYQQAEPDLNLQTTPPSSSSKDVAYLKDGNLWLWRSGKVNQLTQGGRVSSLRLSEDGSQVAFVRQNGDMNDELWVINLDGTDERLVVGPDDLAALPDLITNEQTGDVVIKDYEWISGGYLLAFNTERHLEEAATGWNDDLRLVDANSGELITLLPAGSGGGFSYSPDGSQVAISTSNHLSLMNSPGTDLRLDVLEYPSVRTYSEYQYYPHPVWSPDSQYLLLALPPEDPHADPPQATRLLRIPTDGSPVTQLSSIYPGQFALSVSISPDLSSLAYLTQVGELAENQRQLHLASLDGTGDHVVQQGYKLQFLGWAVDGQHFAYSLGDPETWYIGGREGESSELPFHPEDLSWVDSDSFLHVENLGCVLELRLSDMDGISQVIDRMWKAPVSFDFSLK